MPDAVFTSRSTQPSPSWLVPATPPPGTSIGGSVPPRVRPTATEAQPPSPNRRRKKSRPAEERQPTPDSLRVSVWEDDLVIDTVPAIGFYTERYYGPIVGPTCLLIVRSLAGRLSTDIEGFSVVTAELAASIGCSSRTGASSQFWKALRRGGRFGLLRQVEDRLLVRTELSPLTSRHVQQLPAHLRREHRLWKPIVDLEPEDLFSGAFPERPVQPLEVLRQAALGRCTPEELRSLDRARLMR